MVKVGLLAYIALWSSASSAAPTENDNIFDERACTVPANLLTNPGFESGLGPWYWSTSEPLPYDQGSASVVTGGHNSAHAIQLDSKGTVGGSGAFTSLYHDFTICKNGTYKLKWDMVQSKGKTTYGGSKPYIIGGSVELLSPNNLNFLIADFTFSKTGYNASVYSAPTPYTQHPVSQWTTYTASFPDHQVIPNYVGKWKVRVSWNTFADPKTTAPAILRFLMDNFVVVNV